eukprot:scaffold3291_cov21-Tisochrysis_lutea.AAC.1
MAVWSCIYICNRVAAAAAAAAAAACASETDTLWAHTKCNADFMGTCINVQTRRSYVCFLGTSMQTRRAMCISTGMQACGTRAHVITSGAKKPDTDVHMYWCAGDDNGEEALIPATSHTSLEHQAKLRAMATSTTKLLEETAGYMAGVRAQVGVGVRSKLTLIPSVCFPLLGE